MRLSLLRFATLFVIAASLVSNVSAADLPQRKPGLWEIKMSTSGASPQVISQCIDASTDTKLLEMGNQMAGTSCSKNDSRREGDAYINESECTFANTKVNSTSKFHGDFNAAYRAEILAKYDPPMMGMKESSTILEASYKGDCKPGQKPGDIIMPNGVTMNVSNFGKMPAQVN